MTSPALPLSAAAAAFLALASVAHAGPLDGQRYIIELSSSQYDSGYGAYLVPPLAAVMAGSGMRAANGPGADIVVNVLTQSDTGNWVGKGEDREWLYEFAVTVGLSPESFVLDVAGTPAFGMTAVVMTPNADSDALLDCMIRLAARTALANYRPEGHLRTDGSDCLRR